MRARNLDNSVNPLTVKNAGERLMFITKRMKGIIGAAVFLLVLIPGNSANAQTGTLSILTKLVPLFEKAGDIIASLAKGIEEANASGLRIYDTYNARAARKRLLDLRTDILVLPMVQRTLILDPIDDYLAAPSTERWMEVQSNFEEVLGKVVDVEERLKDERSDFVLEPEFPQLLETVHTRAGLLRKLKEIEPPQSEAELDKLQQVRDKYARLINELERTRAALDAYIAGKGE